MKFSEQKVYFPFKSWIHDQAFIKQSQEEMIGFMNIPQWTRLVTENEKCLG